VGVDSVFDVSDVHAATLFGPEDRESTFILRVGNTDNIYKGKLPKSNVNFVSRVIA
jgi:hypothetical protein